MIYVVCDLDYRPNYVIEAPKDMAEAVVQAQRSYKKLSESPSVAEEADYVAKAVNGRVLEHIAL